jgi:hypothetical protein
LLHRGRDLQGSHAYRSAWSVTAAEAELRIGKTAGVERQNRNFKPAVLIGIRDSGDSQ